LVAAAAAVATGQMLDYLSPKVAAARSVVHKSGAASMQMSRGRGELNQIRMATVVVAATFAEGDFVKKGEKE
jgi:hypothetical protein